MVTQQDIYQRIATRPFQPFRVTLQGGETVDVVRRFQAVVMPRQMVVATDEDRLRWIELKQIEHVDQLQPR